MPLFAVDKTGVKFPLLPRDDTAAVASQPGTSREESKTAAGGCSEITRRLPNLEALVLLG